jgi:hypothetical protein
MPSHVIPFRLPATIRSRLNHGEPTGGKGVSRMARTRRQYGSGCLLKRRRGWAIRWREWQIAPDGTKVKVLRFETLGDMTRSEAAQRLTDKLAAAGDAADDTLARPIPVARQRLGGNSAPDVQAFDTEASAVHAQEALVAQFGDVAVSDLTRQAIQGYVAQLMRAGYAPKSIAGVPGKVIAQLMGHAAVDTTLNIYTQVLDGSVRAAVGGELFTIVH